MGKQKNNTSGFKGVCFHKHARNWRAHIKVKDKYIHLGCFKTAELAADAYKKAQEKYHSHRPQI